MQGQLSTRELRRYKVDLVVKEEGKGGKAIGLNLRLIKN